MDRDKFGFGEHKRGKSAIEFTNRERLEKTFNLFMSFIGLEKSKTMLIGKDF